ncbi:cupin domain-containing protein [Bhargavaea changchunensis]|uniref:Cupin domain-containing protein n=2 Tax=Bhargavaea changchunensis TaxID=2134037 RepID=A0ABW2NE04_9BACL|nr:cupin domain-containing protein [Bhargavaea sp. CC-171006]
MTGMDPAAGYRHHGTPTRFRDHGRRPYVVDIHEAALANPNFRTTIWTGNYLQVTLMSIPPGGDIGKEIHPNTDQFLRIEQGQGIVQMGRTPDRPEFTRHVKEDDAILIPAGYYHNFTNTCHVPIKMYSIYAPPQHPPGTVHQTKEDAMEAEESH